MPTLFDPRIRASILDRISRLTHDRSPSGADSRLRRLCAT
jgi:hypothetical protein